MKNNFDWEEFLRVAKKLSEEEYDLKEDINFNDILERRAEEIKEKIVEKEEKSLDPIIKDLLNTEPDQISEAIKNKLNIKIGKFMVCNIRERHKPKEIQTKIMENKIMNNGKDLLCTVPVHKDFRFKEMPNVGLFNKLSSSAKLTHEQLIEIVRWLQVIEKYDFLV